LGRHTLEGGKTGVKMGRHTLEGGKTGVKMGWVDLLGGAICPFVALVKL